MRISSFRGDRTGMTLPPHLHRHPDNSMLSEHAALALLTWYCLDLIAAKRRIEPEILNISKCRSRTVTLEVLLPSKRHAFELGRAKSFMSVHCYSQEGKCD
jgi:hypothetical protein